MRRRELLFGGAATLLASGLHAAPAKGVRFGARTPFPGKDLRERALLLDKLGYDGIELGPEYLDRPADAILADLRGTRLAVSAIVGSIKLLAPDPEARKQAIELDRRRLDLAKALGAVGVIEVPTFGPCKFPEWAQQPTPHEKEDQLLVDALEQLAPDVKRTGVAILIEPLTKKETHYMNLQAHGAKIIERVGAPGFRLLSDYYHMQLEEADIGKTLAAHGRHTAYVHLADGEKRTQPGSLPFDYRPGFRSLKKHGFAGWINMEFKALPGEDAATLLANGLAYIKKQWAEA
jgi:sugar phosphate isomerase/epimerase